MLVSVNSLVMQLQKITVHEHLPVNIPVLQRPHHMRSRKFPMLPTLIQYLLHFVLKKAITFTSNFISYLHVPIHYVYLKSHQIHRLSSYSIFTPSCWNTLSYFLSQFYLSTLIRFHSLLSRWYPFYYNTYWLYSSSPIMFHSLTFTLLPIQFLL